MLTAEEIRSRTFLTSLRGFDRDEVKAFLGRVADVVEDLQSRAREFDGSPGAGGGNAGAAPAEAAPEDAAAEESAAEEPGAEESGAEESGAATGGARETPSPFAEMARETQRILEAAQAAAEDIRQRAREDAEREVKAARARAARIIAEGERRREDIERAVEALTGARAELSDDLRSVGRAIERVLRELAPEPAAATVREALAAAAREDPPANGDTRLAQAPGGDGAAGAGEATAAGGPAEPGEEPAAGGPGEPGEEPAGGAGDAPALAGADGGQPDEPEAATDAPGQAATDAPAQAEAAAGAAGAQRDEATPARGALSDNGSTAATGAGVGVGEPLAAAPQQAGAAQAPPTLSEGIAAARAAAEDAAQPSGAADAGGANADAPDAGGPGDQARLARRARDLAPLHPRLVRRLKRGLQDLQNTTLDSLRRDAGRKDVERFLPDAAAVRSLSALAEEQLRLAHAAGIAAGRELVGAQVHVEATGAALAEQLGSELGGVLVTRLAEALRQGFDAGEALPALAERVDAAYGKIKNGPAGDVATVALARAYEGGQKDAWSAAGVTHRRWVRGVEPPCTDPRCVDNESAGPVPLQERFPSRHDAPPVRPGCSCSTAPAGV